MVPDDEYYTTTEDYALVGASAKLIRREINEANDCVLDPPSKPSHYGDVLRLQRYQSAYDFVYRLSRVVYADVDDSSPEHEREVKQLRSEEQNLTKEDEKTMAAREALAVHLLDAWKDGLPPYSASKSKMTSDEFIELKKRQVMEHFEHVEVQNHAPGTKVLDYIVGPGHEHRKEFMDILSDQSLSPSKRPVILLIGMLDSMRDPTPGVKSGWALAYDVVTQQIMVKPFFSDKHHHPLTSSWNEPVVNDGVSFTWSPMRFITEYQLLAQSIDKKIENHDITPIHGSCDLHTHLELQDHSLAFRMLVHSIVAKWVLTHWQGLISYWSPTAEETTTLRKATDNAYSRIKGYLRRIPFPAVVKTKVQGKRKTVVHPFDELEWSLEEQEDYFRCGAVSAREEGEEKIARNMAMLYERILGLVRAFNEDPKGDL